MAFVPIYILILVVTIVVDYLAGLLIERSHGRERRRYLVTSIIVTCAVLFVFKYYNFFGNNANWIADQFNLNFAVDPLALVLPIGLSFHTFQSLSYVIEVYRGNQKAERHFGIYSLYVMFYPQLVAGPIERPQNLLHQLRGTASIRVSAGGRRAQADGVGAVQEGGDRRPAGGGGQHRVCRPDGALGRGAAAGGRVLCDPDLL